MQPNILFILIDDMGWRDLGCYGSSFYETPHIDRLAREGMRFPDAYASCPVCSPTRASILTGKYPATVGITNWIPGNPWGRLMGVPYFDRLPLEEKTIAAALRDGGYQTWHVGKWHLGPKGHWPEDFGFDVNIAGSNWGAPWGKRGYFSPYGMPNFPDGPEGEYLTDRLTDEAMKLIRQRDASRPFFMHLSHYAVHTPIQAPADLVAKYERKARELGLDKLQAIEQGEELPALHLVGQHVQRRVVQSDPTYAAMVENLDTNIGRVLALLDEQGLADNTVVVFTSDNGGLSTAEGSPTCNHPLAEGKGWMYDGGVREPLLVRWPGAIAGGSTCGVPVTSTDFYPTFLEAAALPLQPRLHCDGVSIISLLRGGDRLGREAIFWHYPHYSNQGGTPACAIRSGDWKLIKFFEDDRLELYNLREDIEEDHNLAGQQPQRVKQLHEQLMAWQKSVEAKIPEPNPHYEKMKRGEMPRPSGLGRIPGDDRS
jgi:arylsulfatase A-like enzyme